MKLIRLVFYLALMAATAAATDVKGSEKEQFVNRLNQLATDGPLTTTSPPIRLHARVAFSESGKAPLLGSFLLVRLSTNLWREQIVLSGYEEARTVTDGKLWMRRTADFEPANIRLLREALNFPSQLRIRKGEKIHRVRIVNGDSCGEIGPGRPYNREICVNEHGQVASVRWMAASARFEDKLQLSYSTTERGMFPTRLSLLDMGRRGLEIEVLEFARPAPEEQEHMLPPPASEPWDWCAEPTFEREMRLPGLDSIFTSLPTSSDSFRLRVYALLDVDGQFKNVTATEVPQGLVNVDYLVKRLKSAKLSPATCDGKPVKYEWLFSLNFNRAR